MFDYFVFYQVDIILIGGVVLLKTTVLSTRECYSLVVFCLVSLYFFLNLYLVDTFTVLFNYLLLVDNFSIN